MSNLDPIVYPAELTFTVSEINGIAASISPHYRKLNGRQLRAITVELTAMAKAVDVLTRP